MGVNLACVEAYASGDEAAIIGSLAEAWLAVASLLP
jgi:hypothetical protein